jgi:hypothetical protein
MDGATTRTVRFLSRRTALAAISVLSARESSPSIFVDGFEAP